MSARSDAVGIVGRLHWKRSCSGHDRDTCHAFSTVAREVPHDLPGAGGTGHESKIMKIEVVDERGQVVRKRVVVGSIHGQSERPCPRSVERDATLTK
jgi:hypothetical protein